MNFVKIGQHLVQDFIKRTTLQKCQGPLVAVYIDPTEAYYQDSGIGG